MYIVKNLFLPILKIYLTNNKIIKKNEIKKKAYRLRNHVEIFKYVKFSKNISNITCNLKIKTFYSQVNN